MEKKHFVTRKVIGNKCYVCEGTGMTEEGKRIFSNMTKRGIITTGMGKCYKCKACNGTGIYKENHYYHTVTVKGQKICIDGDSLK